MALIYAHLPVRVRRRLSVLLRARTGSCGEEQVMIFPERPTCHDRKPRYGNLAIEWRDDGTCSYCGSLSPEKLLGYLSSETTRLSGSDWKYGWPHKFYITAVNPDADKLVQVGTESVWHGEEHIVTPIIGHRETLNLKWYNEHLGDDGYDDEAMRKLLFALTTHSGIEWIRDEKGIRYKAPYHGYQRTGLDDYDMRQLPPQLPGTIKAE